jgi:glycosyltransferase involved in cell wall biosynthesis
MKYLFLTDVPTPWREKVLENVYNKFGNDFHVVYCNDKEKRRLWEFPLGKHSYTFLNKNIQFTWAGKERYFNFGIVPLLFRSRPRIIIVEAFDPAVFLTLFLAKVMKSKIAWIGDTWLGRDVNLSWYQRMARKVTYNAFIKAFIGASKETLNWYKYYNRNIPDGALFISQLCADNEYFAKWLEGQSVRKRYEIMFSGRIVKEKNPLFIPDVAWRIKEKLGTCRVLIIGDGDEELKTRMFKRFEERSIDYDFPGFIEHSKLPEFYSQAKTLLLPTSGDCWGVVINEALASGVPVITTNMTAAAGELVIDGENGFVLPLDAELWAERIVVLLKDEKKYDAFSKRAREIVSEFTFERAAQGIIGAIEYLDNLREA